MSQTTRRLIPKILVALAVLFAAVVVLRYLSMNGRLPAVEWWLRYSFLGAAGLMGLVAAGVSYYEYHGIGCQDGVVRRGPFEAVVSLTFDDGPHPQYTSAILDVLKEEGVKATFFVVGRHVRKYPEVARRIAEEGHDVGNHTFSHRDLVPSTRGIVLREVGEADRAIREVTGTATSLFRPPRGIFSQAVRALLVGEGYTIVLWTVSAMDWRGLSAAKIAKRVRRYVRPGGIVLFHDSGALLRREGAPRANTVQAVPLVIDELRRSGFEIVPVSEMLRRLECREKGPTVQEPRAEELEAQEVLEQA